MKVETESTSIEDQSGPLASLLTMRIIKWRKEIQLKSSPDQKLLKAVMVHAAAVGVDPQDIAYVVGGCEWYFRICILVSVTLRKMLKSRLADTEYSPFGRLNPFPVHPFDDRSGTFALDRYVDTHLGEFWDSDHPEMSRLVIKRDLESIVKRLERPFLASTVEPLPPKPGGYGPEPAPWIAASVIYTMVRNKCPGRNDPTAKVVANKLLSALLDRPKDQAVDDSFFHRKRRRIAKRMPQLPTKFLRGHLNVTEGHRITIENMLKSALLPEVAWYWLSHEGL